MGTAQRKAREKLLRHQQILDAAYEVFQEVGYSAATMDQVAERAELAKGTLYLYFKSKEDVYFSLLTHGLAILLDLFQEMESTPPPPDRILEETAKTLFRFYAEHASYFRLFMVMQQEDMQAKLSPELARHLNAQATAILNILRSRVETVLEAAPPSPVNPWHVANILWGAFTGITQLAITREQMRVAPEDIDALLSLCFALIQRGLSAGEAPKNKKKPNRASTARARHK